MAMRVEYSREFKKQYEKLPPDIRARTAKHLRLLMENPRHPSLDLKKLKCGQNLWQARVTKSYRFVFLMEGNTYYLVSLFHHRQVSGFSREHDLSIVWLSPPILASSPLFPLTSNGLMSCRCREGVPLEPRIRE